MLYAVVGGVIGGVVILVLFIKRRRVDINMDGCVADSKPILGPRPLPLIGNALALNKQRMQCSFYDWMQEYGSVYKISILSQEMVIVSDPALMRDVFAKLRLRPESLPNELNYNGSGVTLSNFEGNLDIVKQITWQILHDTYKDHRIVQLEDEILDEFIDYLISDSDGTLDVDKAILRSIATQLSAEMTGNKPTPEVVDASLAYFDSIVDLFSEGRALLLTLHPWLRYIPGKNRNSVNENIRCKSNVVEVMSQEAKRTYMKGEELGMIHRFMSRKEEENTKAGVPVIKDENVFASCIIDVIGGGFRGTSAAISSCILYMLLYPDIRAKIDTEITCARRMRKQLELVESDLPYLSAYIMECMRLSSVIYVTLPHHVDTDQTIAGYRFKKDQIVTGCLWNAHHVEKIWGDPFNLRPERFLDDAGKLVPSSHPLRQAFVPLSVGARDCKGKYTAMDKVFKYISRILYRCEITPAAGKELPSGDPRDFRSVVALFLPKYYCTFTERK